MKRFRMKQDILQIVIPLIIVSLILQGDLMAKRVAELSVEKIDQETIKGKLIHVDVEEKSLVLNSDNGGIKIYMDEIHTIKVKKKSLGSNVKGFLLGFVVGGMLGLVSYDDNNSFLNRGGLMVAMGCSYGLIGLAIGTIVGNLQAPKESYKKIRVKGKSPKEVRKILKTLKKKAL